MPVTALGTVRREGERVGQRRERAKERERRE
jgi:hypothetical protein